MEGIKFWNKESERKDYTEWKHTSLPKAVVVQETQGSGWYINWMREHPNG